MKLFYFVVVLYLVRDTVHPRLSEQAELNLKTGRSDIPKIRIIEDRLNHHQNE